MPTKDDYSFGTGNSDFSSGTVSGNSGVPVSTVVVSMILVIKVRAFSSSSSLALSFCSNYDYLSYPHFVSIIRKRFGKLNTTAFKILRSKSILNSKCKELTKIWVKKVVAFKYTHRVVKNYEVCFSSFPDSF